MFRAKILAVLMAGWMSAAGSLGAASPPSTAKLKQMSVEELLNQEVVSVSRKPERWGSAASNIFLIRGQGAVNSGASTLPQLLRLAPNLFVAQSSASHWAVNARGFVRANGYSNKLLVLIDGRTVYSPLFSNVFWDSQDVFMPDVERVEVISGPSGSAWGSNAVNGVINVLSKSAHETQGGLFYTEAGTRTKAHFGVRHGGHFGETGAFRVYAKHAEHDSTFDAAGRDDGYDPWRFTQTGFRADWGVAQESAWTLQGDAFRGEYENGSDPRSRNDGVNMLLRWSRRLSPESQLTARVYHDYTKRDTAGAMTETARSNDIELQHRTTFGDSQELLWGGSYRMVRDHIRDTDGFAILPPDLDFELGSLFFQHQAGVFENSLRLITGYRIEHNHFSGWEHQPSVRAAWDFRPDHMVWASASRATRTPSRLDVGFFAPAEPPYYTGGGPDFGSEILHAYEFGWRGRFSAAISVTAVYFHHDYESLRSVEPPAPFVVANGVEGRSSGIEVFVDWDVSRWWRLRMGYFNTQQDTWVAAGGADLERALGESSFPEHQVQFRNTFQITRDVSLWTSLRHVAEVPWFDGGIAGEVPAYTEFDARISWRFTADMEVAVTGRNLLDRSHPEIGTDAGRREIPRSVQASVRWAF